MSDDEEGEGEYRSEVDKDLEINDNDIGASLI